MDQKECSYTVGGNVSWYSRCGKTVWGFLRKLTMELPYDPAYLDILSGHRQNYNSKIYMHPYDESNDSQWTWK